jgi:DNA polymerase
MPDDLFSAIARGDLIYAWNTNFEWAIWKEVCVKKLGWPELPFLQLRDTQAISLNFALPMSLGNCGEVLDLDIQKDKRGSQLIKWLSVPQKPTKAHPHTRRTPELYPDLFQEFYAYCGKDVRSERAILKSFPWELSANELEIWRKTLLKNERGIPVDVELVTKTLAIVEEYLEEVSTIVPIITNGAIKTINQGAAIISWCELQGYEIPNFQAPTIVDCLNDPDIENYPAVKSLLEIRQLAGKSSIKKFKKILAAVCRDGRVRDCLKYHKATTGREGGKLLQPQNLPRAVVDDTEHAIFSFKNYDLSTIMGDYDDVLYAASALIRPSIMANLGKKFIVSDYSQIENRVVLWLAGQDNKLKLIDEGLDLYRDMASALYQLDYDKIGKESDMRRHGKLTCLGCGYGMGWKTFRADCLIKQKFDISEQEAKRTINIFRDEYHEVVNLWYGLQDAAIEATICQGTITSYGAIQFMHTEGYLFMILPNGKSLAYPEAKVEEKMAPWGQLTTNVTHAGINPKTKKWGRTNLTPGRLAENATQATAREILMEAVLDIEELYPDIILTVHDEVVLEVPEDGVSLDEINEILCNRSDIYSGLPLKAAGFETLRYHK